MVGEIGPTQEEVRLREIDPLRKLPMYEIDRNPFEQESLIKEVAAWCQILREEFAERERLTKRNTRLVHKVRDLIGHRAPTVDRKPYKT